MLLLGRRAGQGIRIDLAEGIGQATTVAELSAAGDRHYRNLLIVDYH